MPLGVTTIQRPSSRLMVCTGPRPGKGAPSTACRSRRGLRQRPTVAGRAQRPVRHHRGTRRRSDFHRGNAAGRGAARRRARRHRRHGLRRGDRAGDVGAPQRRAARRFWRPGYARTCCAASRLVFSVATSFDRCAIDFCIALLSSQRRRRRRAAAVAQRGRRSTPRRPRRRARRQAPPKRRAARCACCAAST